MLGSDASGVMSTSAGGRWHPRHQLPRMQGTSLPSEEGSAAVGGVMEEQLASPARTTRIQPNSDRKEVEEQKVLDQRVT